MLDLCVVREIFNVLGRRKLEMRVTSAIWANIWTVSSHIASKASIVASGQLLDLILPVHHSKTVGSEESFLFFAPLQIYIDFRTKEIQYLERRCINFYFTVHHHHHYLFFLFLDYFWASRKRIQMSSDTSSKVVCARVVCLVSEHKHSWLCPFQLKKKERDELTFIFQVEERRMKNGWVNSSRAPMCTAHCWLTRAPSLTSSARARQPITQRLATKTVNNRPTWNILFFSTVRCVIENTIGRASIRCLVYLLQLYLFFREIQSIFSFSNRHHLLFGLLGFVDRLLRSSFSWTSKKRFIKTDEYELVLARSCWRLAVVCVCVVYLFIMWWTEGGRGNSPADPSSRRRAVTTCVSFMSCGGWRAVE